MSYGLTYAARRRAATFARTLTSASVAKLNMPKVKVQIPNAEMALKSVRTLIGLPLGMLRRFLVLKFKVLLSSNTQRTENKGLRPHAFSCGGGSATTRTPALPSSCASSTCASRCSSLGVRTSPLAKSTRHSTRSFRTVTIFRVQHVAVVQFVAM